MEEAIDENELRLVIWDKLHITNESRLENGNFIGALCWPLSILENVFRRNVK